jgi:hypothetical protein
MTLSYTVKPFNWILVSVIAIIPIATRLRMPTMVTVRAIGQSEAVLAGTS